MALSILFTVSIGAQILDACPFAAGQIAVLHGTGANGRVDIYSLSPGTSLGGGNLTAGSSSNRSIGKINATHLAISDQNTTTSVIFETGSLSGSNFTGTDFNAFDRPQQIAGDSTLGVAFSTAFSSSQLIKFTTSAVSLVPVLGGGINANSSAFSCITSKGDGSSRWILGTVDGRIIEITDTGFVVSNYCVTPNLGITTSNAITGLHYITGGWLTVCTNEGFIYLINHDTQTILQCVQYGPVGSYPMVSRDGGIGMVSSQNANNSISHLMEWDVIRTPMEQKQLAWTNTSNPKAIGYDTSGYAWAASGTQLLIFTMTGFRSTTPQTELCTNPGSVQGLTTIIDDSAGAGLAEVLFQTTLAAGGQPVPVTTGLSSILKIASIDQGTEEKFDCRRTTS